MSRAKQSTNRTIAKALLPLVGAGVGLTPTSDAGAQISPRELSSPSPRVVPKPNVIAVAGLTLDRPIAKEGETVTATGKLLNLSDRTLETVGYSFAFPNGVVRAGTVRLGPKASAEVTANFPASAAGTHEITLSIDPEQRIFEPLTNRFDNMARTKAIVVTGTSDQWTDWTRTIAATVRSMIDSSKARTCVGDGRIDGMNLKINNLVVGSVDVQAMKSTLTGRGVPDAVAQAAADAFVDAYKIWAREFRGDFPAAYPAFAAFPGGMTPPMPNVPAPIGAVGGSARGTLALSPIELENGMRTRLGARANERGAPQAIKTLAASMSAQITTWLGTQMLTQVMGSGPVPAFAPPYVPVGPVVGGKVVNTDPNTCGHLKS